MSAEREIFANAPLAWVACEIRFPLAPGLTGAGSFESLAGAFFDTFPIPMETSVVPSGETGASGPQLQFRFLNKTRTMSVSVTSSSLLVETTKYEEWDSFKFGVVEAVKVVANSTRIVGVERVGLRYINEIRVPADFEDASGWKGWINNDVLGHLEPVPGYVPESSLTVIQLDKGTSGLEVRYAALTGRGVVSDEPLKRRYPVSDGPFFVVDADSSRDTSGEKMLDFSPNALVPVLDELHEPIEAVFQHAVTEKSRNLFRGDS